jgi:hypothetical protein
MTWPCMGRGLDFCNLVTEDAIESKSDCRPFFMVGERFLQNEREVKKNAEIIFTAAHCGMWVISNSGIQT